MTKEERIQTWRNWKFLATKHPDKFKVWTGRYYVHPEIFVTAILSYREHAFSACWDIPYNWDMLQNMKWNQDDLL